MHNIEYITKPEKVDRRMILDYIMEDACNNGDGYSGPMHWHDEIQPLESYEAAQKRIQMLDKGWYDDHAVRYYDYTDAKPTKRIEDLKRRIAETNQKLRDYEKAHSVKALKADYVGCQSCGSKLKKELLRGEHCPLCGKELRSPTTLKTLKGYNDKISALWKEVEDEKRKQASARKVKWLIKYEYHS